MMNNRPQRPTQVLSNFFKVDFKEKIFKYNIEIEGPEVITPVMHVEISKKYICKTKENRLLISEHLGENFLFLNGSLYSSNIMGQPLELIITDEVNYKIKIIQDTVLDPVIHKDTLRNLLGRFFKILIRKLKLKQIGRKLFDPSKLTTFDMFEVWPGFATSLMENAHGTMLNIDFASKIITNNIVFSVMNNIRQRSSHELEAALNRELIGQSVMTTYNRRFYRIDRVVLDKTPQTVIELADGKTSSFLDYYSTRYNKKINVLEQPLLASIDRKTGKEIYLIPELCVMTGLNDDQRANRGLMTELDKIIKPDAGPRLQKSRYLIDCLQQNENTKKFMEEWKININSAPVAVDGIRIEAGSLLFGDKRAVDIENSQNLD